VILVLLLLLVLAIFLFRGLALFVTKFFIIGLLLLPCSLPSAFSSFGAIWTTRSDEQQAPHSDH
jgi:hypothetical protein